MSDRVPCPRNGACKRGATHEEGGTVLAKCRRLAGRTATAASATSRVSAAPPPPTTATTGGESRPPVAPARHSAWRPTGSEAVAFSRLPEEVVDHARLIARSGEDREDVNSEGALYDSLVYLARHGLADLTQRQAESLTGGEFDFVAFPKYPYSSENTRRLTDAEHRVRNPL